MKKILLGIFAAALVLLSACSSKETVKDIHTEAQKSYLADAYTSFTTYAKGTGELSIPQPVELKF